MKQLLILGLLAHFHVNNCLLSSSEEQVEAKSIPIMELTHVRVHGERKYLTVSSRIHSNRTQFDLYVRVNRLMGSNNLIMNINMRAKFQGFDDFKTIFNLKRLDFCVFLTEYNENFLLRAIFKKTMDLSDVIVCPVRVGNYSMTNVKVADNVYPQNLVPGVYKFFIEIVEVTGDVPKVFAMQVNTNIYA